jgi:hypothetical protein
MILSVASCDGKEQLAVETSTPRLIVGTGTYFGECIGYCRDDLRIDADKIVYVKRSNIKSEELPDRVAEMPTSRETWTELVALVDINTLRSLPDTIGLPDQMDQGGEYIEVSVGDKTKRIDFEYDAAIPELDDLLKPLRSLREDMASRIEG